MQTPLLRANGLYKDYGSFQAVRGVDFKLMPESYVTLLGPSGCGKTSILRMIGGFEEVSSGRLELDGKSLVNVPAAHRPINTVFQSYALFPHLNVLENVGFGLAYKGIAKAEIAAKARQTLAAVQMEAFASRRPRQLSGGQQQRVALARAIVNEPRLLLLDEPLSALDRRMRRDMQIELKDLQRRLGMTFLHVTHDQEEAFALSDWIIVMNRGKIEQQGVPSDIYRRPATAYVADFIGGSNLIKGKIVQNDLAKAVIDTALGRFTAPALADLKAGEDGCLCIRPEQLHLAADPPAPSITAVVTHAVFAGSNWQIEARAAGQNLTMTMDDPPAVGQTLSLGFQAHRVWIARDASQGESRSAA